MNGRRRGAPDISDLVAGLERVLSAEEGRLQPEAVARARAVLGRTDQRLSLGAETTVVALAGATGTGKSSLFNALAGMEISDVGARRPTTGHPRACAWSGPDPGPLLDWLDVPSRHRVSRESVLDADREAGLHGLLLLDLPDHDSTDVSHRLEVDRLAGLVDLLVWVVDPQKYADDALHSRYLRPLAGHDTVMLVVLNQVDLLAPPEVETCRRDLRRLLDADGLESVRLLVASARRGDGVDRLRSVLAEAVRGRQSVVQRVMTDLESASRELGAGVARREPDVSSLPTSDEVMAELAAATGLSAVLDAVEARYLRRACAVTGWPPARWVRRLRRRRTANATAGPTPVAGGRADGVSLAEITQSQRALVDLTVRQVTTVASDGLPRRWADAVRGAVAVPGGDLTQALDSTLSAVDLGGGTAGWWRAVQALQLLLTTAAAGGAVAGAVLLATGSAGSSRGAWVAGAVFLGGLVGGALVTLAARACALWAAGRHRQRVRAELTDSIRRVGDERILAPVVRVLADHKAVREALAVGS